VAVPVPSGDGQDPLALPPRADTEFPQTLTGALAAAPPELAELDGEELPPLDELAALALLPRTATLWPMTLTGALAPARSPVAVLRIGTGVGGVWACAGEAPRRSHMPTPAPLPHARPKIFLKDMAILPFWNELWIRGESLNQPRPA
jgi:hypothetical protein